jgi:hypothetical protein
LHWQPRKKEKTMATTNTTKTSATTTTTAAVAAAKAAAAKLPTGKAAAAAKAAAAKPTKAPAKASKPSDPNRLPVLHDEAVIAKVAKTAPYRASGKGALAFTCAAKAKTVGEYRKAVLAKKGDVAYLWHMVKLGVVTVKVADADAQKRLDAVAGTLTLKGNQACDQKGEDVTPAAE